MRYFERIDLIKEKISKARQNVHPEGQMTEGIRSTLELLVDYIDFMVSRSLPEEQ
jgi:hypothetical protein